MYGSGHTTFRTARGLSTSLSKRRFPCLIRRAASCVPTVLTIAMSKVSFVCLISSPGPVSDFPFAQRNYERLRDFHYEHMEQGSETAPPASFLEPTFEKEGSYFKMNFPKKMLRLGGFTIPHGYTESGPCYLYPSGHGMDWHTNVNNLHDDSGTKYMRMYIVTCTG
jgi:hypothetical protein